MNGFNIQQIIISCVLCSVAYKSAYFLDTSEVFSDQLICKNGITFETDKSPEWQECK